MWPPEPPATNEPWGPGDAGPHEDPRADKGETRDDSESTLSRDCRDNFEPPDKGSSHLDADHMTLEIDFATEHGDIRIGDEDLPFITGEGLATGSMRTKFGRDLAMVQDPRFKAACALRRGCWSPVSGVGCALSD